MPSKIRKILRKQQGFTLVELMTVLIILGVVLGIGIPKYMQIQNKAEWDADEATIRNMAKAAEAYAASMNLYDEVKITDLAGANLIDGTMKLNRIEGVLSGISGATAGNSYKNKGATAKTVAEAGANFAFKFKDKDGKTIGSVVNLGAVVKAFIGKPPYGEMPDYPTDVKDIDELATVEP